MQTLRIFRDVARHRSFSTAAAAMGMTQSAVSQRVGQLERRLGVTLIDRSVRPLTLTSAGAQFMHGCCDLIERYEALEDLVSGDGAQLEGQVRVDAIYSAGIDLLNWVKASFEKTHPRVCVRVEYKRPDEVYDAVREARCDLGIVSYPQRWQGVCVQGLRDERMVVVCGPGHPLAGGGSVHVSQLDGVDLVAFESDLPVARRMRQYFKHHGVKPVISNMFDNIDTMKTAVLLTGQATILPYRTVKREAESGVLSVIRLVPQLTRPVGIIHTRRNGNAQRFSRAVQEFIDFLLEHAGPSVDVEQFATSRHQLVSEPA